MSVKKKTATKKAQSSVKKPTKTAKVAKTATEKAKTVKTTKTVKNVKAVKPAQTTTKPKTKAKTTKKSDKVTKIIPKTSEKAAGKGSKKLKKAKEKASKFVFSKKQGIITSAIVALVVLVSGVGIGISAANNAQSTIPEEIVQDEPVEEIPEEPEEPELPTVNTDPLVPEPSNIDPATYEVAAYKPKFLSIPSLAAADPAIVNIPIVEIPMLAGNQLGAPESTRIVGWYYRSAIPGQAGASVMDAHGGALGTGIFKVLPQAKIGTEIIIEMGDGRKFTYVVREITYKKIGTEADKYMDVAYQTYNGEPTLALITCTGTWLPSQRTYDLRMFVRATLKQ